MSPRPSGRLRRASRPSRKTFAWAAGSLISGYLLTFSSFGWPLLIGGIIKGVYDILLLVKFQKVRPPEEAKAVGTWLSTPVSKQAQAAESAAN